MYAKKKLKFAIIGCGSVAIDHGIAIEKLGHQIVYGSTKNIHSSNWKFFKKNFPLTKFLSTKEILKNKDIDRIISCLPIDEQTKYCKKLLSSKKPILIEKPLHFNSKELEKIFIQKNIFLKNKAVAYNRRNYGVVSIVKNKIKKNKIKSVEINISENYSALKKKYKKKTNKLFLHTGSSSNIIDLSFFFFVDLNIINKWVFKEKQLKSIFVLLSVKKNFPIFVKINSHDSEKASIKVRFFDNTLWSLSPIEELNIYKGNKVIKSKNNYFKKTYEPVLKSCHREEKKLRPGFLKQMKNFANLNFKELSNPKQSLKLIRLFEKIS